RHHAGCSGGDSRRLGQDLVVAQFNSERASEITLHWYILSEALTGHTYESSGSTYAAPRREPDFLRCTEVIPPAEKLTRIEKLGFWSCAEDFHQAVRDQLVLTLFQLPHCETESLRVSGCTMMLGVIIAGRRVWI